jgi:hypothetical protein
LNLPEGDRPNDRPSNRDVRPDTRPTEPPITPDRPSIPERPGIPGRPSIPERPGIPGRPGIPEQPIIPERPGIPEPPIIPGRPGGGILPPDRTSPLAWRPATWRGLYSWVDETTWYEPNYYDYGDEIYYEDDNVYEDGQQIATGEEYAQQAITLADDADDTTSDDDSKWLPLGVFAMTRDKDSAANMIIQLAVNKQGVISGSYQNESTEKGATIQGAVDKKTQRAAWSFGHKRSPVMETGIANLTKDTVPALVHFGTEKTQSWFLIRQTQSDDESQPSEASVLTETTRN